MGLISVLFLVYALNCVHKIPPLVKNPIVFVVVQPDNWHAPQEDPRAIALKEYLHKKKSPLESSVDRFIAVSEQNPYIDWTLLPAIAGVESNFETMGNTHDHNPFGYMCPGGPCYFPSFEKAISKVATTIETKPYYARFRATGNLYELAKVYNQVSPDDWVAKVQLFERQIKEGVR